MWRYMEVCPYMGGVMRAGGWVLHCSNRHVQANHLRDTRKWVPARPVGTKPGFNFSLKFEGKMTDLRSGCPYGVQLWREFVSVKIIKVWKKCRMEWGLLQ
jgi:hypothetical protein